MSDTPKLEDMFAPWREWPEYRDMLDLVAVTGAIKHAELDALCASVWREAATWVQALCDAMLDNADDREQAERTRADDAEHYEKLASDNGLREYKRAEAAEARAARLAALVADGIEAFRLTREYVGEHVLPPMPGWSWFDWTEQADAALADSGEA